MIFQRGTSACHKFFGCLKNRLLNQYNKIKAVKKLNYVFTKQIKINSCKLGLLE